MNGRCETDPFDQARNVCGICYGEFCLSCLMEVKGRKHPLCTECAIISSGVRAGAKPAMRGQKRTAAARRAALQEAPIQDSFQFFDAPAVETSTTAPDSDTDTLDGPESDDDTKAPKRKRKPKTTTGNKTGKAATPKKPAKNKTAKKAATKSPSSNKSTQATAGSATSGESKKKHPAAATGKADQTLDGSTSPADEAGDASELAIQAGGDDRPSSSSAVDQLDSIRELEITDPSEPSSFRKPRPFIKPKSDQETSDSDSLEAAEPKLTKSVEQPPATDAKTGAAKPGAAPMARRKSKIRPQGVEPQQAPQAKAPQAETPQEKQQKKPSIFGGEARRAAQSDSDGQAQGQAESSAPQPGAAQQPPVEQPRPETAAAESEQNSAAGKEPSITSELSSPFSVAPPPPLPRRRADPTPGQDAYERANPDAVETTPPDQPLARRRTDQQSEAEPSSEKRRSSDDPQDSELGEQSESSEHQEPTPMAPPAWTQRSRTRKDDAPETASADGQKKTEEANDQDQTVPPALLPKRQRTT